MPACGAQIDVDFGMIGRPSTVSVTVASQAAKEKYSDQLCWALRRLLL